MPRAVYGPDHPFLARAELLTFEEIERLARLFAGLGVRKFRLTGGEPLLRRDLPDLVSRLAALGPQIALTTNGSLLRNQAGALYRAGVARLNVSLDALEPEIFQRMNDAEYGPADVLEGIAAAERAGFSRIKINVVVQRSVNEASIAGLVQRFRGSGHVLRFIEYMDVGESNGWRLADVVPAREILDRVAAAAADSDIEELPPQVLGEVARRYRLADGSLEVGVISSVSAPFCGDCVRARLSADGKLFTCLFATRGIDLKQPLRAGATDEELAATVRGLWRARDDRYSEIRSQQSAGSKSRIEMSYIGG